MKYDLPLCGKIAGERHLHILYEATRVGCYLHAPIPLADLVCFPVMHPDDPPPLSCEHGILSRLWHVQ